MPTAHYTSYTANKTTEHMHTIPKSAKYRSTPAFGTFISKKQALTSLPRCVANLLYFSLFQPNARIAHRQQLNSISFGLY